VTVNGKGQSHADWHFLAIAAAASPRVGPDGEAAAPVAALGTPFAAASPAALPSVSDSIVVPRAERQPDRSRCARIGQADASACAEIRRRYGPNAGDPCTRSAAARAEACAADTPIPPLQVYVR
jgi:hypothetical protein